MRYQGKITSWKDEQGYGFITPNGGGEELFVHIKSFTRPQRRPVGGEIVTYQQVQDSKGRPRALAVAFVSERRNEPTRTAGPSRVPLAIACTFLLFVAFSALSKKLPLAVLGLYLIASGIAYVAYAIDKSAARKNQWRTAESTLHGLALIGGWPGALLAQNRLRHKSRKMSFQLVFWTTVLLNCGALGWLFTAAGGKAFRSAIGVA